MRGAHTCLTYLEVCHSLAETLGQSPITSESWSMTPGSEKPFSPQLSQNLPLKIFLMSLKLFALLFKIMQDFCQCLQAVTLFCKKIPCELTKSKTRQKIKQILCCPSQEQKVSVKSTTYLNENLVKLSHVVGCLLKAERV